MEDLSKLMLITDMDGTLLTDDKKINPIDLKAIEQFKRLGGIFTIATGRNVQSASQYFKELNIDCPVILYNGGMIFDVIHHRSVYIDELHECAEDVANSILNTFPTVACEILTSKDIYVVRNNEYEQYHNDYSRVTPQYCTLTDFVSNVKGSEKRIKMLFAMPSDSMSKLIRFIDSKGYGKYLDFVKSTDNYYEMLPKHCSKGTALKHYKELLGLKDVIIVSVGDYNNDIEMLQTAHIGIAPNNALERVKRSADFVTNHNNNTGAIAETIDYIISKFLPY
ncbi:MAG: Cof-type HAD-IIB family hydrolase [Ruminococcus sp.]|nr:Cof-type HAD-IIB family hydrolase [Ruminococcus sp.]